MSHSCSRIAIITKLSLNVPTFPDSLRAFGPSDSLFRVPVLAPSHLDFKATFLGTKALLYALCRLRFQPRLTLRATHRPPKYRQNGPSSREMLPLLQEQGKEYSACRRTPIRNAGGSGAQKMTELECAARETDNDDEREHATDCDGQ
jgi:hypothetical protein